MEYAKNNSPPVNTRLQAGFINGTVPLHLKPPAYP